MSEAAVRVEKLGKKFSISHQRSGDLRDSFRQTLKNLIAGSIPEQEEFWALRDVSFEVQPGEAVGIIGRNGAGKSTLLKILSRISFPTLGRIEINGRISSLLEVGTGFHSELTGRENIVLNGTILGMRRGEIRKKFDAIVDFSGVEKFIDTPVKHYSSGMKVRLAFSVAAFLEPEILIVDEVLAVGDAEFQKKCLGKMGEVSRAEGRTVLFVSHNLSAVEYLCPLGILLENGEMVTQGNITDVVGRYLHTTAPDSGTGVTRLSKDVSVTTFHFSENIVSIYDDLEYVITIESSRPNQFTDLVLLIYNHMNERVGIVDLRHKELTDKSSRNEVFTVRGTIKGLPLIEGTYHCGLFVSSLLCYGDFLNLRQFEVARQLRDFIPYALKYRGYLEFNNTFLIQ